jgi:hypothetical protein
LYFDKRLADFEAQLRIPALDDGKGGKKAVGAIVHTAYDKLYRRFSSRRRNGRGRPRTLGP